MLKTPVSPDGSEPYSTFRTNVLLRQSMHHKDPMCHAELEIDDLIHPPVEIAVVFGAKRRVIGIPEGGISIAHTLWPGVMSNICGALGIPEAALMLTVTDSEADKITMYVRPPCTQLLSCPAHSYDGLSWGLFLASVLYDTGPITVQVWAVDGRRVRISLRSRNAPH